MWRDVTMENKKLKIVPHESMRKDVTMLMSCSRFNYWIKIGDNEQLEQLNSQIETKHIAIQTRNKSNVKYLQANLFLF